MPELKLEGMPEIDGFFRQDSQGSATGVRVTQEPGQGTQAFMGMRTHRNRC